MGRNLIDLVGQRFDRLIVTEYLGRRAHASAWRCVCDCGGSTEVSSIALKSGTIRSCGCYRRERMGGLTYKHGERGGELRQWATPEYKCWERIKTRCYDPLERSYRWYGARGIKMADVWLNDFGAFLRDVGRRPALHMTLDRIDGNRDYEPGNVRWSSWVEQARNRSNNRIVSFNGEDMTLAEAAERAGLEYRTVKKRLRLGWSEFDAVHRPLVIDRTYARRNTRPAGDSLTRRESAPQG